eukprot:scaffold53091_cov63-Phaeocystis_antarctica.AAC.2
MRCARLWGSAGHARRPWSEAARVCVHDVACRGVGPLAHPGRGDGCAVGVAVESVRARVGIHDVRHEPRRLLAHIPIERDRAQRSVPSCVAGLVADDGSVLVGEVRELQRHLLGDSGGRGVGGCLLHHNGVVRATIGGAWAAVNDNIAVTRHVCIPLRRLPGLRQRPLRGE